MAIESEYVTKNLKVGRISYYVVLEYVLVATYYWYQSQAAEQNSHHLGARTPHMYLLLPVMVHHPVRNYIKIIPVFYHEQIALHDH